MLSMTWMAKNPRPCEVDGCERHVEAHDLCHTHYAYLRRTGRRPTTAVPTSQARFEAKVNRNGPVPVAAPHLGPCSLWTGAKSSGGRHGAVSIDGKRMPAHRAAWVLAGRELPDGLDLDHLCKVTLCVRIDHLEPKTHRENVLCGDAPSAANARKTHCPKGHPLSGANLFIEAGGGRRCITCKRDRNREAMRRKRAAQ
jgi:hypothetical protein